MEKVSRVKQLALSAALVEVNAIEELREEPTRTYSLTRARLFDLLVGVYYKGFDQGFDDRSRLDPSLPGNLNDISEQAYGKKI